MSLESLNQLLLDAHKADDKPELANLYRKAGDLMLDQGDINAGCFYLTHAYVFALDTGSKAAKDIHQTLIQYGREK